MIRCLVVDDSRAFRAILRAILSQAPGVEVVGEAGDGDDAVAKVLALRPDVVTMDVRMPGKDGLGAIEEIMARAPTPIVVVSAEAGPERQGIAFDALGLGAIEVLGKPRSDGTGRFERDAEAIRMAVRAVAGLRLVTRHARLKKVPGTTTPGSAPPVTGAWALRPAPPPAGTPNPPPRAPPPVPGTFPPPRPPGHVPGTFPSSSPSPTHVPGTLPPTHVPGTLPAVRPAPTLIPGTVPVIRPSGGAPPAPVSREPAPWATAGVQAAQAGAGGARVLGIAASTGGPAALARILAGVPADYPLPILVVQHIAQGFEGGLVHWLAGETPLRVKLAVDGEALAAGTVFIGPDGRHMGVAGGRIRLWDGPPVRGFRPSGTVLFQSLATQCGANAVGLVLSGMGDDGAEGLAALRARGAWTAAQGPATSVIFGMPRAAIERGAAAETLELDDIPGALARVARRAEGAPR